MDVSNVNRALCNTQQGYSPRQTGRGRITQGQSRTRNSHCSQGGRTFLPLPFAKGEGRGEGFLQLHTPAYLPVAGDKVRLSGRASRLGLAPAVDELEFRVSLPTDRRTKHSRPGRRRTGKA